MKNDLIHPAAIRGRGVRGNITQKLELRPDECTNTLTTVEKDNVIVIVTKEEEDIEIIHHLRRL